jgi:patatin-related protein
MATVQTGDVDGCEELRIALVMNGGVSLAVWMGGVSNEIFNLVKRKHPVYQMLLDMTRTSARVDVISGTSAGGINGAALSLAFLYDGDFSQLRSVWLETGAFGDLLRPVLGDNPGSLLMGDEFFLPHIEKAFYALARTQTPQVTAADMPIDLRLTTTLLTGRRGKTVDDLGVEVNDVDYRAHFLFRHSDLAANGDFGDRNQVVPRLARAARSTASFPFAFEPSFLSESSGLGNNLKDSNGEPLAVPRYVVDGGLLDNKPFKGALQAIFGMGRRQCVRRVLAYVNPDPGDGRPGQLGPAMPPVGVVVADSVLGIPQSQSISDQLTEIRDHNDTVRRRRDSVVALTRSLAPEDFDLLPGKLFGVYRERRLAATFEEFVYAGLPSAAANHPGLADGLRAIGKNGREQLKAVFIAVDWCDWIPLSWPPTPQHEANQVETWAWGLFPVEFAAKVMLDILRKAQDLADYTSPLPYLVTPTENQRPSPLRSPNWGDPSPLNVSPAGSAPCDSADIKARGTWDELGRDWNPEVAIASGSSQTASAGELPSLWERAYEQIRRMTSMRLSERPMWDSNTKALLAKLDARVKSDGSINALVSGADFLEMFALVSDANRRQTCARLAREVADIVNAASRIAIDIAQVSLNSNRLRQTEVIEANDLLALSRFLYVAAPADRDATTQQVIFKLLQLEVIEFAFNDHASLDSDAVIEFAQFSGDSVSPLGGLTTAKEKLLGLQLAHFGAFYKQSWRANDWTFGRLDGAERLIRILLNPERLHRFYYKRSQDAAACIEQIGRGSIVSDILRDKIDAIWEEKDYRDKISAELRFLDDLGARLPDALPVCAEALTTRIHFGILREEIPELISAIASDQGQGADASGASEALLRTFGADCDESEIRSRPFSPEKAQKCLMQGLIAKESLEDEAGSDLFTRTLTHTAATLQNLLASKAAKLGPVSTLFASLKVPILGFYFVARGLTHQSRTSAALNGGILTAGLALVCVMLWARPSPAPGLIVTIAWAMLAYGLLASVVRAPRTVGLVVWLFILIVAVATKGLLLGAIALAVFLLTISVAYERLQWLQLLIGFIVILVASAWEAGWLDRNVSPSGDRIDILVLAGVVCFGLLLAIWEALPISTEAEQRARKRWKAFPANWRSDPRGAKSTQDDIDEPANPSTSNR